MFGNVQIQGLAPIRLPDTLLPWKPADNAGGHTVKHVWIVFIFYGFVFFFIGAEIYYLATLLLLISHCFDVSVLPFSQMIFQLNRRDNNVFPMHFSIINLCSSTLTITSECYLSILFKYEINHLLSYVNKGHLNAS